jgi:hypothetical protein
MPQDGVGGVRQFLYTYTDRDGDGLADDLDGNGQPDFFAPTDPAGGQPMLWGAGDNETPPDGRCGDHDGGLIHDPFPPPSFECYSYDFGVCPGPLGASIGFWCRIACGCPGDANEDGVADLRDLALLLADFGAAPSSPCADGDGDGIVGLSDLAALLAAFGLPCSC